MTRISDVAKLAGVSTATVSRVLSNAVRVSPDTRRRVLEAIEALDYQPNISARNLRKLETNTIIVVVPDITNMFFSRVLLGVQSLATSHGYQVLLGDTHNDIERERGFLNALKQKRADGMILLTARVSPWIIEEFSSQYPIVLACEYIEGSHIPTVSIDNISAARKATEHLIKLGHRRIGCILGPMNVVLNRDRLRGYEQALASSGIDIEPILIQEGDYSYESGYNLLLKLFAMRHPPTAVFAANDEMAIGVINAVRTLGMSVPRDVAVVGFDDIRLASIVSPALTTIAQPAFEIGYTAATILLDVIAGKDFVRKQVVLEDRLVIRESCGYRMKAD
ncbi:MAG: LacI family transcriptional regulator [Alicyclobacillus sp.]|nr:LacI family transcriptional regulator [Alicyclobacillus sp.]